MLPTMKDDETPHPEDVGFLGARTVVTQAEGLMDLFEQSRL